MKNMFFLLILIIFSTGCSEDESKQQDKLLQARWQLFETFTHPPSGNGWDEVENGHIITINTDNSFISNQFQDCNSGNVVFSENEIQLIYDCEGFTANFEAPEGTFKYSYLLIENVLELTPLNFNCFEGCKYRLTRLFQE